MASERAFYNGHLLNAQTRVAALLLFPLSKQQSLGLGANTTLI